MALIAHLVPSPAFAQVGVVLPHITLSAATASYNENRSATVRVTATLQTGLGDPYTNTVLRGVCFTITPGGGTGTAPATPTGFASQNPNVDGTRDFWVGGSDCIAVTFDVAQPTGSITFGIFDDDVNEGNESFTIGLAELDNDNYGDINLTAGGNRIHTQVVTIVDDDPPGVTLTPNVVDENAGVVEFTLGLNGEPIDAGTPTFIWNAFDETAVAGLDYVPVTPGAPRTVVTGDGSTPTTFSVEITEDEEIEGDETFIIAVESPTNPETIAALNHVVTIRDNDQPEGPDPILSEISNHLIAQSDALLATQPRLTDYVRNTGIGASDFALRVSDGGLEALDGGVAGEGFWGEATFSRSGSRGADGTHAVASLGAHRRASENIFLGGMLQFDRTVTELDGGGRSGEFVGEGWMAGPYVVARDPSRALFLEGRLLYGHASHDADAVVADADRPGYPRDGAFDGERWIAQARVEGEYPLGAGTIMYPLADFSHARNAANGFDETNRENPDRETDLDDAVRTAVSKLQLGAEFEIPLDPARGDLIFRPGLKLVVSDRNGGASGKSALSSAGRVDFGVDYRLEAGVALGFQGYYSGIGQGAEFKSYGAGLRLRMEF